MTTVNSEAFPAAALWDMDGTIIDTEPLWLEAERSMLSEFGIAYPEDLAQQMIGSGLTAAAKFFQELGVPLAIDEIIQRWTVAVIEGLAGVEPDWRPGARELLAGFAEAGIPNVLVTMSVRPFADAVLRLLPKGLFAAIITGDAVEHEKPHPDPYFRGAAAVGLGPEDCIAFEDSLPGVASAVASGAVVVGVPNIIPLDGTGAHEVLSSLAGIDVRAAAEIWSTHRTADKGDQ